MGSTWRAARARWLVLLVILALPVAIGAQELRLMTYNIRFDNPDDGDNRWDNRRDFLASQIRSQEPDVLGIQEGLSHQVTFLADSLPDHKYVGVGRDDGRAKGEFSAIFYNSRKLRLTETGTFWLSETPSEVSVGWDAALPRICTWARFAPAGGGRPLVVFNTHFDHKGAKAREESARLLLKKIAEVTREDEPFVLMGDLNAEPGTEPIRVLEKQLDDSALSRDGEKLGPGGTFNGFRFDGLAEARIDYIFLSRNAFRVRKYAILNDSRDQRYPSDHFPVVVVAYLG